MPHSPEQPSDDLSELTPKHRAFVNAYLGGVDDVPAYNGTAAARSAGYKAARQQGSYLLANPAIRAHVDAALRASGLSRDVALALVIDDATMSVDDIVRASRKVNPGPAESALISALISARTTARTNLAKAHGLLTDNVNLTGDVLVRRVIGVEPEDV